MAFKTGDYERAERQFQERLAIAFEVEDLVYVALNHDALVRLALAQGEYLHSREHLQDALRIVIQLVHLPILLAVMTTAAELFAKEGDLAYSALLATFVKDHPASQAKVEEQAEELLTRLEEQLSVDDLAVIRQHSQQSDLDSLAAQLVIDLEKR